MSDHNSHSLFVPEESPPPAPRYALSPTWQRSRLTLRRENDVGAVLSPQAFETDHFQNGVAATGAQEVHDPAREPLPDHPYFRLDIPLLHGEIDAALRDLWIALQGFEDDDTEMANQREVTQQGREIGAPKPLVVTTVGPAGVGKSFLYKALFNRPNITKSSAEGRSCTLYPTKIILRPKVPTNPASSNIDIEFFDAATIATMTENHIRRYHEYHFGPDSDPADDDSRRYASTAKKYFDTAFNTKGNAESATHLQSLLTAEMIGSGDLLRACVDAIEQRISSSGATQDRTLSYLQVDDDKIDQIRDVADSLAPFVDFLVIKTGGALLRAGLTFIDLPGEPTLCRNRACANVPRPPRHQPRPSCKSQRHS